MRQAILDTDSVSYFFRGAPQIVEKVDGYLKEHGFINNTSHFNRIDQLIIDNWIL